MFAVAFEVLPSESGYQRYLETAAALRPKLDLIDGFVSIERFRSITRTGWILSLSLWRDEDAVVRWRGDGEHHAAQAAGRHAIFDDYRIRVVRMMDSGDDADRPMLGLWEHPAVDSAVPCSNYESLTTPDKQIALVDFADSAAALNWQQQSLAKSVAPSRVLCGSVVRDYGMFERAQAPQVFPDAIPRK